MKIALINGPNLNLLGTREPGIYGSETFDQYFEKLQARFPQVELDYFQSNVEGELINRLHQVGFDHGGILLNAGGYTHTSVAIRDAVAALTTGVVEVHISNIYSREEFRHISLIAPKCRGSICGLGLKGYDLGIRYFLDNAS
ncbi:MAG TPA: type II 3-dehydroquinate dehydratase [Chitinophagaceae bacterium]|nr:type II 3-dehydroquinate dehydratase [Chitinophagaceae bacterium]